MRIARRLSVVVLCYLLSSYGIIFSLILIGMSGIKSLGGTLVGLLILLAWTCHVIMSANWVKNKPAENWVPFYGTCAGTLALILWPVADSTTRQIGISDIFHAIAIGITFTLPCLLLAIYLVRFHLRAQSARMDTSVS